MKPVLPILKSLGLILLLATAGLGYQFFHVWQKNERPTAQLTRWEEKIVILGHQAVVQIEVEVPWHREIKSARPQSFPSFLIPQESTGHLTRGALGIDGMRTWSARIPLVVTEKKDTRGLTLNLPLKPLERPSPNSFTVSLPPLEIQTPGGLPPVVNNSLDFLSKDTVIKTTATIPLKKTGIPWLPLIGAGLVLAAIILIYLRSHSGGRRREPWEDALKDLSHLEQDTVLSPDTFFSELTDILKRYMSRRFPVKARTQTSSEFLRIVNAFVEPNALNGLDLPWLSQLADDVKFAGRQTGRKEPREALATVRRFVDRTIPKPDPDADA